MAMGGETADILKDVRVLELADEKAGFCGRLLADLGATVIKVEPPGGDASRKSDPFCPIGPNGESISLSFVYDNIRKKSVVMDLRAQAGRQAFERLLRSADVLVETAPEGYLDSLSLDCTALRNFNPRLVHLSITPFGRSGPKRAYAASATVSAASGGQMSACRDGDGTPVALYGSQPFRIASLCGAVAVLMHLRQRLKTGAGSFIDLSVQEAVASSLDRVMVDYFSDGGAVKGQDRAGFDPDFSILPCRDGYIQIPVLRNRETLAEILAAECGAVDPDQPRYQDPSSRFDHIIENLKAWTRRHTKQELFELGQAMAFPWSPVEKPEEVLQSPQLKARNFFIRTAAMPAGPEIVLPGSPYRFGADSKPPPLPPPFAGQHTEQILEGVASLETGSYRDPQNPDSIDCPPGKILEGIRVLDLTRMLSGPYCTRTLADFGAEVLKIQTGKASSGAEQNNAAYFKAWNRNKRSITLDLDTPQARELFLQLVAISDIVVENYSPRVMANWDLGYERLLAANPSLIMLSLSAMGSAGPWKDYVGFGPTFHSLSGLTAASSTFTADPWTSIGHAYADTVAGLYGALSILAALARRDSTGKGCPIDLSCYEAMCTFMGPALMRVGGTAAAAGGLQRQQTYPDRCYRCAGNDRWCAVTIRDEEQWELFCDIVADPELKANRFATRSGREQYRAELDARIGRWTSARTAASVEATLQPAGIAAHAVCNAEDLACDPQLEARGFFTNLSDAGPGESTADRSAVWPWRSSRQDWRAAPARGEANYEIFVKLLKMPEDRFRDHVRRGIIG